MKLAEKLIVRGVESLTDSELLTLLFDEDTAQLSDALLESYSGSVVSLSREKISRLRMMEGVGLRRAQRLLVATEWGRRAAQSESAEQIVIASSADVVSIFRPILDVLKHEECWVLFLNRSNRVVERSRISQGGITATVVDHRLIVKRALELLATHIVLVHNHPSGSVEPSSEDIALTQRLVSAAALFDIELLDHIILAPNGEFSMLGAGVL